MKGDFDRVEFIRRMEAAGHDPNSLSVAIRGKHGNRWLVRDILRRKSKNPRRATLDDFADELDCYAEDFIIGSVVSEKRQAPAPETSRARRKMPGDIPVYGVLAGRQDGAFFVTEDVIDYVERPPGIRRATDVYAVFVIGDSMAPAFREGQVVFVHPGKPPQAGSDVVVQLMPGKKEQFGECYLKRLVRRIERTVILEQFNPRKILDFPIERVKSVHRVLTLEEILGL